jgi:hypothetical protein
MKPRDWPWVRLNLKHHRLEVDGIQWTLRFKLHPTWIADRALI